MRLVLFFLLITTCLQAQVQRLKLRQLENATETTPNYSQNGAVPIANSDGTLVYSNVASFPADFPNGLHSGINNAYKNRGLASMATSIGTPNVFIAATGYGNSWTNPTGRLEAGLDANRASWTVLYYANNASSAGGSQLTNCPSMNFVRIRTNNNDSVVPPLKDDPLFQIRGAIHRGLIDTLAYPQSYANGYRAIMGRVDTVWETGEISTRLEFYARTASVHGNNSTADGSVMMSLEGESRDIRMPFHTSSRNDVTTPINFLYTNNLGDLRSSPLSDIIATGTFTHDVGSILAGGITEIGPFVVTGVVADKPVTVGVPTTFEAGLMVFGYASAAGQVKVRIHNTTGAPVDPANQTYSISQVKL